MSLPAYLNFIKIVNIKLSFGVTIKIIVKINSDENFFFNRPILDLER